METSTIALVARDKGNTVNPKLGPPGVGAYLFQTLLRGGGVNRDGAYLI